MMLKSVDLKMLNHSVGPIKNGHPADHIDKEDARLRNASKKLEGQFLTFMLKAMENTIPKDKNDEHQNMASMMFSSVMGEEISNNGGIGLADFIYKSLKANGGSPTLNIQNPMMGLDDIDLTLPEVMNNE